MTLYELAKNALACREKVNEHCSHKDALFSYEAISEFADALGLNIKNNGWGILSAWTAASAVVKAVDEQKGITNVQA